MNLESPSSSIPEKLDRLFGKAKQWSVLWGISRLVRDVNIEFSEEIGSTLGRFDLERMTVSLNGALLIDRNEPLLFETLCHELAHAAAAFRYGSGIEEHGPEWCEYMRRAGFTPRPVIAETEVAGWGKFARNSLFLAWICCGVVAQAFEPTAEYQQETVAGAKVYVSAAFREHPSDRENAIKEIQHQLTTIREGQNAFLLRLVESVPIWLEWRSKTNGAAEYHPSIEWLKANGYNPEKAKGIEINNARNFVKWSESAQPSMLLHELAHAFHDQVLGWQDAEVKAAYEEAQSSKRYERVAHVNGRTVRAYALNDEKEYFAEMSESYLGRNDFHPFTRSELREFDNAAFSLMESKWTHSIP